jgi:hypothetical protein
MDDPSTFSVVRREVWPALARCLEDASRSGVRAASRDVLIRPIELLKLMASDALGALGNDVLAAERMRMLLYLTAPFSARVQEARSVIDHAKDGEAAYEPGALDHGALLLVALAAMRVAPSAAQERFARTVHGLALSAAPAEVLGRLVPRIPETGGIAVILDTLYLLDTVGAALNTALRPFDSDPAERGRWRCLDRLLHRGLRGLIESALRDAGQKGAEPVWDGADASTIETVIAPDAAGGRVLLKGNFKDFIGAANALRAGVQVVFATADDAAPRPVAVRNIKRVSGDNELTVELPTSSVEGWFGFSDDRRIEAARAFRMSLRTMLAQGLVPAACLRGSRPFDPQLIPLPGTKDPVRSNKWLATPPRTATNRFPAMPERPVELRAFVGQPPANNIVSLRALQLGRDSPLWEAHPLQVEVLLDGVRDRELTLYVDPPLGGEEALRPQDGPSSQRVFFQVPAKAVRDGIVLTAVLGPARDPVDRKTIGPLTLRKRREAHLLVIRPQVVSSRQSPVDRDTLRPFLKAAGAQLGIRITLLRDLPWVDDELAVLDSPLHSADDARVPQLLEALSRRAMLTPNLESAIWICLVPEAPSPRATLFQAQGSAAPVRSGFYRLEPGEAARGLAVADTGGLVALLAEMFPPDGKRVIEAAPTSRLRLLGTMSADSVQLEPVREEVRRRGPGAQENSGLTAACLDGEGRELLVEPLRCLRHGSPAQLAALLPVTPLVSAIEIRRGLRVLARIHRVEGSGHFERAQLEAPTLAENQKVCWRFHHSRNARPNIAVAIGARHLLTEVLRVDPCNEPTPVHLTRFAKARRLAITASDGWNATSCGIASADGKAVAINNPHPVVIRKLPDGRWFADVPAGFEVSWSLDGTALQPGKDRTLSIPYGLRGMLRLEARKDGGSRIVDERPVPEA